MLKKANTSLAKILPEQKISLRTESGERTVTLSPVSRLLGSAALVLAGGWIFVSSAAFVLGGSGSSEQASVVLQEAYEARLGEIAADRDALATHAQDTRAMFQQALAEVSLQQSDLLGAAAREAELSASLDVLRGMLQDALSERETVASELASLKSTLTATDGAARLKTRDELDGAIGNITAALDNTARERDAALAEIAELSDQMATLQTENKIDAHRRDRMLEQLEDAVAMSLSPLNSMFRQAGVDVDSILSNVRSNYSGTGGREGATASSKSYGGIFAEEPRLEGVMEMLDGVQLLTIASQKIPFVMPVRSSYRFTSPFGFRSDPKNGSRKLHEGMDMAGPRGTPIYATADGVVTFAGWQSGYGNVVKLRHSYGFETLYAHQNKIHVTKGQKVSQGDRIGDMGNTGRSTGTHLHYEILYNGTPVNPMTYVKAGRNVY